MSVDFVTTVDFLDKKIHIKELTVSDFKIVLKALIEADNRPNVLFETLQKILLLRTSLIDVELQQLNIIEFLHLLFIVRLHSGTNTVMLTIENKGTTTNLHINLDKINERLHTIIKNNQDITYSNQEFKITYGIPAVAEIYRQTEIYHPYIKQITFNDKTIILSSTTSDLKTEIIKRIPLQIYKQVSGMIYKLKNKFEKIDLLDVYKISDLYLFLSFDSQHIISIVRLLFYENLLNLYQNIFALCKYTNLTPEYIEKMSIGELGLYVKMLEVSLDQKQNNKNTPIEQSGNNN